MAYCFHSQRLDRRYSVADIDADVINKLKDYSQTVQRLDHYYGRVKRQLIAFQAPISGQFPEFSGETDVSDVRTSLYAAFAVWCLHQAYKRIDDDRGKTYELGQSAVKCMRGILLSWMRQSQRVERFKSNQTPSNALHSKFCLATGNAVFSHEQYNHLQIDVVSLYLLLLVQLSSSGLQMIYCADEVAMVQNLVYYVERAYRTPDFGMWQRGNKYNVGDTELHASSIGLAKSALEAVNGCNLFGHISSSQSIIYVDIDAHNRNRTIFETLLPRESSSSSSDMALMMAISFPAFGTHDQVLYTKTKNKLVKKLRGKYGFKRFARDGYGSAMETPGERFYKEGVIQEFEDIECEWPLFYMIMIIDGVFHSDSGQVEEYKELLDRLIQYDRTSDPVVAQYYYVPGESVEEERARPGSQARLASDAGRAGNLFLWGQALLIVCQLLLEELVHINEIDLIRRYLPSYNRPRRVSRYSSFQGNASDLVVQVVLISESRRLQAVLATYGIQTQTPKEVQPLQVWSQQQLVQVFRSLGVHAKLGLRGRPLRPIGALGTSKVYRISGNTILCYPLLFDSTDFYLSYDMALLIDDIKSEIQFIGRYWRLGGRPTCCLILKESYMRDINFRKMIDLLALLKTGYCEGVKVRLGRFQNLLPSSCVEHLDFIKDLSQVDSDLSPFAEASSKTVGYQSLTDIPMAVTYSETGHPFSEKEIKEKSDSELADIWRRTTSLSGRSLVLNQLHRRHGPQHHLLGETVWDHLVRLNSEAGTLRCWYTLRYCSGLLGRVVDSMSPYITALLVSGKQCTIGVVGCSEALIDRPMNPIEVERVFYSTLGPHDAVQAVLQQELVLYCGRLVLTKPDLFSGILTVRIGLILEAMQLYNEVEGGENAKPIVEMAPHEVRFLLLNLLMLNDQVDSSRMDHRKQRRIFGCLGRSPANLAASVWYILCRTSAGIRIQQRHLPQQPTITDMTVGELRFAVLINSLLATAQPEMRQIFVQLIVLISKILQRNPELRFAECIDLTRLVEDAHALYLKDGGRGGGSLTDMGGFFLLSPSAVAGYLVQAIVNCLLAAARSFQSAANAIDHPDSANSEPCIIN